MDGNLTGKFLIAMPTINTPFFARALVYICEHNSDGALGVIVNRPTELTLGSMYEKIDLELSQADFSNLPVYFGGPVQTDRGFVLHRPLGHWKSTLGVDNEIGLTSSRDVLESFSRQYADKYAQETEPEQRSGNDILVLLGYAGWSSNQLEEEIKENSWLSLDGDAKILFETPTEDRLAVAMSRLGVDYSQLTGLTGHA